MTTPRTTLPVAVIGAGPIGLAAAAHLLARGETPIVFEAGPAVGASIRQWRHIRFFSPWKYTVDAASVALLEPTGWALPDPDVAPTGAEIVERYLEPLAALPQIAPYLRLNTRVTAIARRGHDKMKTPGREHAPFVLRVACPDGARRPGAGQGGHRRLGDLAHAQSARRRRAARVRRSRRGRSDRLRHPGRPGR